MADDPREALNVVFIGHVDAGKSTIGGHLMLVMVATAQNNPQWVIRNKVIKQS